MAHILLVDDDALVRDAWVAFAASMGHTAVALPDGAAAMRSLASDEIDVVFADVVMCGVTGIDLCRYVAERQPDVPVVIVTGHADLDVAIAALRAGAFDFIVKPVGLPTLRAVLDRALSRCSLARRLRELRESPAAASHDLLGDSPEMVNVRSLIERVAGSQASVLITGASGTGKEVVARAIHACGPRASKPFVSINCAALPEALLESELFGHVRGAFTDARDAREGLFVMAHGGTLFLDEIGDLPLALQPKLLRVLQERRVRPVGGKREREIDIRLVAATNQDLSRAVDAQRFRSDLYFRLNVVNVVLPPLRARDSDVLLLAHRFLERYATSENSSVVSISPAAARLLLEYHWPGNVRELQNCIHRAVTLARGDELLPVDLPENIRALPREMSLATDHPAAFVPLRDVERRYVSRVLASVAGNKSNAARILGIDRKTLQRKLET